MRQPGQNERRSIGFEQVSQVMPEVRRLLAGHRTVGNWSLAQICDHLRRSFVGSMEGFDLRNHRVKRFFLRRKMLDVALTKGIPPNWTVDRRLTPPSRLDLAEAVEGLDEVIERYQTHSGGLHPHPLFGKLSREVWTRVHCVHCAHHLSFVREVPG